MAHLQHSDASGDLIECMSEESVNMKPETPSSYLKNIITFEQNGSFLEDGSLEESALTVPEEISSTFHDENTISIDDVPWAWSDGFSEGSEVMELESPPSALESMAYTVTSHDHKLAGSSLEFEVAPLKTVSLAAGELINQTKESSNGLRSMIQEAMRNSMTSSMASSSKDATSMKPKEQKQVNGLKVDEKQKGELPMLRSSMLVKTSLLGRVRAKKKVDAVVEPSITKENSRTLDRTVKSIKPKQTGVVPNNGLLRTSLSPIKIKKRTFSPPKRIHLSPKSSLVLKTKSSGEKYRSPTSDLGRITGQSSQESGKIARNAGMSKAGGEKILKQIAESQASKSTVNYAPGLNNRKLRLLKNQVEAGNVEGVKENTLHVIEQKLVGVAPNCTEQNHMKLRSQELSGNLSTRFSISSSSFLSSSCEEDSDRYRLTIIDASGSKKTPIGRRKERTPLHVVEQKVVGVALKSAEQKHTKMRSQQPSSTLSSRSSISSSAFVLSDYEEENDGSRLISNASGPNKTHIGERKGGIPLHVVEHQLFSVALNSAEQMHPKLTSQLSSRSLSSSSSISSSAFVSSNFVEENDESQLTISDASGSNKTQIGEGNGRTPLNSQNIDYKKIQRTENVRLEDKSLSLDNMPFRKGKEDSPQREVPDERRLTSMQEKAMPEAENFEVQKGMSSFRGSSELTTPLWGTVCLGSSVVAPKHEDVQEKNTQTLFNDVIEETANKLVGTRKSKVKALVSAFESIISLQE